MELPAVADAVIRSGSPNQPLGTSALLELQANRRVLVRADPGAIVAATSGGHLVAATLELTIAGSTPSGWGTAGREVAAHRLQVGWTEGGATWNCPNDTNIANAQADCSPTWTGGNFVAEASDTVLQLNGQTGVVRFDVTADVATLLAGEPNHGWLVKKVEEGASGRVDYGAREGSVGPRLVLLIESATNDIVPPSLAISSPASALLVNEISPALEIAMTDGGSGVDASTLEVRVDGSIVSGCSAFDSIASCTSPSLSAGTHTVTATLRDLAGNLASAQRMFQLLLGPNLDAVTLEPVADTYLRSGAANQVEGSSAILRVRQGGRNRALVRFDLSSLLATPGLTIVSAALEPVVVGNPANWGTAGRTLDAHRVTRAWAEEGATWNCPIDANPTNGAADCATQWAGGEYAAAASASVLVTNTSLGVLSFDVTDDVTAFAAGTASHGWLLKKTDETKTGRVDLGSREAPAAQRPRLRVVLEVAGQADTTPPQLAIGPFRDGDLVSDATPEVDVYLTDFESGLDPAGLVLLLDGANVTSLAQPIGTERLLLALGPLADGPHELVARARDLAGNTAEESWPFTLDATAPSVTIVEPVEVRLVNPAQITLRALLTDVGSGIAEDRLLAYAGDQRLDSCSLMAGEFVCSFTRGRSEDLSLTVQVADEAGNTSEASRPLHVIVDHEPPALAIDLPQGELIQHRDPVPVVLHFADAETAIDEASLSLRLDGGGVASGCAASPIGATCSLPSPPRGEHHLTASIADSAGNVATATASFVAVHPIAIAFTEPTAGATLNGATVRLAGTVSASAASVLVNGEVAAVSGGTFAIEEFPLHEGVLHLVAVATDSEGNTGTDVLTITVDTTPPTVTIQYPSPGSRVYGAQITVTGRVNDPAIGTVNDAMSKVTVNGVTAIVENRTFRAEGVLLQPGQNVLTAIAADLAGNQTAREIEIFAEALGSGARLEIASGEGQTGVVATLLAAPLVVAVSDSAGLPLAGREVVFRVVEGNGVLLAEGISGERLATVVSDAQGLARIGWQLGDRAGVGANRVVVTAVGVVGSVSFTALAEPTTPAIVHVHSGDNQRGLVGAELPLPLIAVAFDERGNALANVPVTFAVTEGGGLVAGAPSVVVTTNPSGLASVPWQLGPKAGLASQIVEATIEGAATLPGTFRASTYVPGDPSATAISGAVLDNQGDPVPGVTVRLVGTPHATVTDAQGQFRLSDVPVGHAHLQADATTATRPGTWASLAFELFLLPGVENRMERPIYILPLDLERGIQVDEQTGGTITLADVPGFALEVAPGSVTFPDGAREGLVSITAVHADKIPMAPGSGMQPRIIVTIQPAGAKFDPPARMTLPNVDGLAPGSITEMFSFDHDLGAFVSIGTATVSEDGLVVRSDPGFGVTEAGWHCGSPTRGLGASSTITLAVTTPDPIVVIVPDPLVFPGAGGLGGSVTIVAEARPSRDVVYSWEMGDTSVATLAPEGQELCEGERACLAVLTPVNVGITQAVATARCETTGEVDRSEVGVAILAARLAAVSFHRNSTIWMDGRSEKYEAPHWKDGSDPADGDADDPPRDPRAPKFAEDDRRFPVAYVRNSRISISAKFKTRPGPPAGVNYSVRATGSHGFTLSEHPLRVADDELVLDEAVLDGNLPSAIGLLDRLELHWEIRAEGMTNWASVGTSDNRVYVTLAKPKAIRLYETLLELGSRNASGIQEPMAAVNRIWSDFEIPIPGVMRKPMDGFNRPDGREMHYWVAWNDPLVPIVGDRCQTLAAVLELQYKPEDPNEPDLRDIGTCVSWAAMFTEALRAQGIDGARGVEVRTMVASDAPWEDSDLDDPERLSGRMLVKNRLFGVPALAPSGCAGFNFRYEETRRAIGVPGQGTPEPPDFFANHFIVEYVHSEGGTTLHRYFDPSYGTPTVFESADPLEAQRAWETASLDGIAKTCANRRAVARKENPDEQETVFRPISE